jgi:hypothetical protein
MYRHTVHDAIVRSSLYSTGSSCSTSDDCRCYQCVYTLVLLTVKQAEYALASEASAGRGCVQGDVYAMGKTLAQAFLRYTPPVDTVIPPRPLLDASSSSGYIQTLARHLRAYIDSLTVTHTAAASSEQSVFSDKLSRVVQSMIREASPCTFAQARAQLLLSDASGV